MTGARSGMLRRAGDGSRLLLQLYAGCLFSASPWVGALLLVATALAPWSAVLGLVAVGSALATAHALRLISTHNPPALYSYSALFLGLIAARTFADPRWAIALATLGAAISALLTASLRDLGSRFGLPSLSLPFVVVYLCALGVGHALGASWADASTIPAEATLGLADIPLSYVASLSALLCDGRPEVGLLVLCALLLSTRHAAPMTALGFAVAFAIGYGLQVSTLTRTLATLNSMFAALALGVGWHNQPLRAYRLALLGSVLCVGSTFALASTLGRVGLTPLSLPFNLSIYATLLLERQRATHVQNPRSVTAPHSVIA